MKAWLLALIVALTALPAVANASWWQNDWPYRKQVIIDASPKGANIAAPAGRAPVLVRLHSGNFSFNDAQPNGADLRFVGADDKTPLAYHIESFDPSLGVATVWVDVPEAPAGSAKNIWMYYGNKKAPPAVDSRATYDADMSLVFHFDDAAGKPPQDRTAYGNNAINSVVTAEEASIIGRGGKFSGAGPLMVAPSSSLAIAAGGPFSFSAWVKATGAQARTALFTRRDGAAVLLIGLDQGVPFVEIGGQRITGGQGVAVAQWTHIAVTADGHAVTLYVNGRAAGTAQAALPAMNSPIGIGGDVQAGGLAGFAGSMDEVRISKTARSAAFIQLEAAGEGPDGKLVAYGADEKKSGGGFGYFGVIIKSVTLDAWVVIGILGLMALMSWYVMWTKGSYVASVSSANDRFTELYRREGGDPLRLDQDLEHDPQLARKMANSSLYRIYRAGADEIERRAKAGGKLVLHAEAINVIRAIMDSNLVRENQRLSSLLVLLTIAISGGPFLGLLGTVVGVMITFAAIAAAGDVNVNAIAPGISAALLATVAGLGVAIPSLFGYNYIITRNKNVTANMQVFIDEFVTRISELYRDTGYARAAE